MSCPITDRQISPPVTKIQKGATGAWNQAERVSERQSGRAGEAVAAFIVQAATYERGALLSPA